MKIKIRRTYVITGSILLCFALFAFTSFIQGQATNPAEDKLQTNLDYRSVLAKYFGNQFTAMERPESISLSVYEDDEPQKFAVTYTIDQELQKAAEDLLQRYKPDYSAIFMMDAKTGKVLVYASYQKDDEPKEDLVKKGSYPMASIFKIVTATAVVDKNGFTPQHKIQFNGGNWTLYKKNVMLDKINRWTRTVTLREAFAKSMNTPFGKIGLNYVEPEDLEKYAEKFMFNQQLPTDFPVEPGVAAIPTEKSFHLTEVASGFNKNTRMSPVQGAMIAASVINEGKIVVPYIVESLSAAEQGTVYQGSTLEVGSVMSPESAEKVKELMEETIISGTSRKSFSPLRKNKKFKLIEMGGKTGHLTGDNPKGRVDWFVGYASNGDKQIAIGTVTVNKKYWTVKSSHLGQTLFRKAFENDIQEMSTAKN